MTRINTTDYVRPSTAATLARHFAGRATPQGKGTTR